MSENNVRDLFPRQSKALDQMIHDLKQREYEIKFAMTLDDMDLVVENLDREIIQLQNDILNYEFVTDHERCTLFKFLVDHYLSNNEVTGVVPKGLIERLKELHR